MATVAKQTSTARTTSARTASTRSASTPWGAATLVEELSLPQRVGERRFSSLVQLLETPKGERLVRFAYATDGSARRGPVTLRASDVERLRTALDRFPLLKEVLLG